VHKHNGGFCQDCADEADEAYRLKQRAVRMKKTTYRWRENNPEEYREYQKKLMRERRSL
jgi:hypothetical protein